MKIKLDHRIFYRYALRNFADLFDFVENCTKNKIILIQKYNRLSLFKKDNLNFREKKTAVHFRTLQLYINFDFVNNLQKIKLFRKVPI